MSDDSKTRRAEDAGKSSGMAQFLLGVVVFVIVACFIAVILPQFNLGQYAQGVITLMLGKYLGLFEQAFQTEFGTTKSSAKKDATIAQLSSTAGTIAKTAAVVATTQAAATDPGKVDTVNLDATGGTVNIEGTKQ